MTTIVHRSRSVRLTITPSTGQIVTIENLRGNDGYEVDFSVTRTMAAEGGEAEVSIFNLPSSLRGALESSQKRSPDDLDQILAAVGVPAGWKVYVNEPMAVDGASGRTNGLSTFKIEADYDGAVSTIAEMVGATIKSERADETTYVTRLTGSENFDAELYAKPQTVFEPGTPTFDVMTFLRLACGLGNGNATPAQWSGLLGASKLDAYYYSTMGGPEALAQLMDFLPLRWFTDARQLWIVAKDGQPYPPGAPPPYVIGKTIKPGILLEMPQRLEGGFVGLRCLLTPTATPGRLLSLSQAALGLEGATPAEIARVEVPPGLYRIEEVGHEGTTGVGGAFDTSMRLKRMGALP